MQYDQRHTISGSAPLTWNFPLLRNCRMLEIPPWSLGSLTPSFHYALNCQNPLQFSHPCKALRKQLLQTLFPSQNLPFIGSTTWLMKKKRNYGLTLDFIMLFKGHYLIASQPLRCPLSARFLHPFIFSPQLFFKQKELNLTHQGSNPWPSQCQIKAKPPSQLMFHANSHTFTIMLSPNTAMYNFKNKNKSTNTPIAHIGLKPKSSHTIKVLSTIWASTITHHTH